MFCSIERRKPNLKSGFVALILSSNALVFTDCAAVDPLLERPPWLWRSRRIFKRNISAEVLWESTAQSQGAAGGGSVH